MRIFEKLMIVLFALGVIFQLLILPGGSLLLGLSLVSLASIYFYLSFLLFNGLKLRNVFKKSSYFEVKGLHVFFAILSGLFLSITLTGIMFYLLVLPGSVLMITAGNSGLIFCALAVSVIYLLEKNRFTKRALLRIVPALVIGIWISMLGKYDWIEYRYRNYPNYVDAYKNAVESEGVSEEEADRMYEILDLERKKMNEERDNKD